MDKVFKSYLKELIAGRTEQLAWKTEKLPEFKMEMERLQDLRDKLTALVGEESAGKLITAARGVDAPIYEHCYRAGLEDGIRLSGMIERLKKSSAHNLTKLKNMPF